MVTAVMRLSEMESQGGRHREAVVEELPHTRPVLRKLITLQTRQRRIDVRES